jgi:uncharacterized membrane protein YoaK (UPF0700 family)
MFRHQGKTRTLSHNLKIASLLSCIAGIVNVTGFFSVQQLTTNVTGHLAFFMDEVFKLNFWRGFVLGIELSQLFFYKATDQKNKLISSIKLRLTIISFFFIGGIIGAILYTKVGLYTLVFAAAALVTGLIYDNIKFKLISLSRKFKVG